MKLKIKERVTKEGRTYQPGIYDVVPGNDAGEGQVTARMADILMADYPFVAEDKPAPKKETPSSKQTRRTVKWDDNK